MAERAEGETRADVARRLDRGETGPRCRPDPVVRDRLREDPDADRTSDEVEPTRTGREG